MTTPHTAAPLGVERTAPDLAAIEARAAAAAHGSTIASLVRRGLAVCGGVCAEVDGDGYTVADDAPWYAVTAEGRAALAAAEGTR